ncbi:MAG TPA: hypothetical protein VGK67_24145 [Myxococcales bacterium]|jgi:hypothetical protein
MRNLLSAILAVTLLSTLGCESCWETRDQSKEAAATPATTPPPATTPAPASTPSATTPPPALAATEPPKAPEVAADQEARRNANPLRRFEAKQLRLGGQRMIKPSAHFRPIRERPTPSLSTNGTTGTTPAQPASGTAPAPAPAAAPRK